MSRFLALPVLVPLFGAVLSWDVARRLSSAGLPDLDARLVLEQGTSVLATLPANAQMAAMLAFAGDDAAALQALLRPLPHYGRQSWLLFDGARATERGIWPSGDSPLRKRFD